MESIVVRTTAPLAPRRQFCAASVHGEASAATAEAEKVLWRFAGQVDERRSPRASATVDQMLDRHLETLDVGRTTHGMYTKYLRTARPRPKVRPEQTGDGWITASFESLGADGRDG